MKKTGYRSSRPQQGRRRCRQERGALLLALAVLLPVSACAPADAPEEAETGVIAADWCESLPRGQYSALDSVVVASDWFQVYEVGQDVYAIYEPWQWQEVISYLVLGTERALLFDTGMGINPISDVVAELTDLPVTVLNSHTHMDHIGGNAEFSSILAMDTEYTRARAQGMSNEQVRDELRPGALCRPLPDGLTQDNYHTRAFDITEVIHDGHEIDLGGRTLEVIHVPGHTPDAIALLDRQAGYLWTGDSFYEGPIWLFAEETDLDAYEESMGRLADLVPELLRIFTAHNTPVAGPHRLVELRDALADIRSGALEGVEDDEGMMRYEVSTFSLLMGAR